MHGPATASSDWSPRRLTRRAVLSAAAVVALAVGAGSAGASQPEFSAASAPHLLQHGPGITRFGPFAGYVWRGKVHSIAGSWTVPSAAPDSHVGLAGTWIGAQAPGHRKAPFIQIGTNNLVFTHIRGFDLPDVDAAWYSDTKLGFHPHFLFRVHAGDAITARMTLAGGRWHIMIVDHTHRHRAGLRTADETGVHFNQAEWLQEDPGLAGHRHAPYPTLANINFRHLRVNAVRPNYGRLRTQWMSANGIDLGPSPLVHGAFTLSPTQPSAIGMQYLQITVTLDVALRSFDARAVHWTRHTPPARISAQQSGMAAAIAANEQELSATPWPGRAEALTQAMVRVWQAKVALLHTAPRPTPHGVESWIRRWFHAERAITALSRRVRRVLGLPQLFPIPGRPL